MLNFEENNHLLKGSSNHKFTEIHKSIADSEYTATVVIDNLSQQRQQIELCERNVEDTKAMTVQSGVLVGRISRRRFRERACLYGIIICLLGGIGIVCYDILSSYQQ